jgi:hypothetical protein
VSDLSFDGWVDLLRVRLNDADHLKDGEIHSFRELMRDHANELPDHFYWEALEELHALGHLHPDSHPASGGDAFGRLSADGRAYLRAVAES